MGTIYAVFLAKNKSDKFLVYADKFYSSYRSELVVFEQKLHQDMMSMLQLLQTLAKVGKKDVLIVSHGWTDGLWLPLVTKGTDTSTTVRIATILLMAHMQKTAKRLIDDRNPDQWFPDRSSRSRVTKELAEVFPAHDFAFKDEEDAFKGLIAAKTGSQGKMLKDIQDTLNTHGSEQSALASYGPMVQQAVRNWWASLLNTSGLGDEKTATSYFDAIAKLHSVNIRSVEIRGCKIGASSASSQVLRRLLGATKLRAPTEVLVTQNPTAGVEVKETFKPKEVKWDVDGGYVKWSPGGVYRTTGKTVWQNWVKSRIGQPRGKVDLNIPLMLLERDLNGHPLYPLDTGFEKLLAAFE